MLPMTIPLRSHIVCLGEGEHEDETDNRDDAHSHPHPDRQCEIPKELSWVA